LRHTYATFALADGRNIHKLAVQMGTSVGMLEKYYSKVSARLNAKEHSGRKAKPKSPNDSTLNTLVVQ